MMNSRQTKSYFLEEQVIRTARQFFNTKGFDYTTITDITVQLDISTDQFHEHFESLDELLEIVWSGKFVEQ